MARNQQLTRLVVTFLMIVGLILPLSGVFADSPTIPSRTVGEAIELAREHLLNSQNADGSIGDFATSGWATMALQAAGTSVGEARFARLTNYLTSASAQVDRNSATELERTMLGLTAVGLNPYNIAGRNFVAELKALANQGQIGSPNLLNDDIFGILALWASGQDPSSDPLRSTIEFVRRNQLQNGGFNDRVGATEADIDTTAAAYQALRNFADVSAAGTSLLSVQNPDGGFPSRTGGGSNVASTAWVVWALGTPAHPTSGSTPFQFLVGRQQPNGSLGSLLLTSYALQALANRSLPIGFVAAPVEPLTQPQSQSTQTVQPSQVVTSTQPDFGSLILLPIVSLESRIPEQVVTSTEPTAAPTPVAAVADQRPRTAARTARRKTTTRQPAQPQRIDQPVRTPSSTFLVAGSYPRETIAQFAIAPPAITVPDLGYRQTQVVKFSRSQLTFLAVLTSLVAINSIFLIAVWRRLNTLTVGLQPR